MWVPGVLLQSLQSYARSLLRVSKTQLCSSTIENVFRGIWLANGSILDEASGKIQGVCSSYTPTTGGKWNVRQLVVCETDAVPRRVRFDEIWANGTGVAALNN